AVAHDESRWRLANRASIDRLPRHSVCTSLSQEATMREHRITFPEIALIAATRGMLGVGIGLLAAERLRTQTRHTVGWTLFAIGGLAPIPTLRRQVRRPRELGVQPGSRPPHTTAGWHGAATAP